MAVPRRESRNSMSEGTFRLTIHPALQQSAEVEEEVELGVARSHNSQADEEQLPAYEEPTPEPRAIEENRAVREV